MARNVLIVVFCLLTNIVLSQDEQRPRVGLVLSGGSAHGFSHIGVIQYLEQQGIPVDYVTGTSMGAIVGGLYAMGYSGNEIEQMSKEKDWESLLSNQVPLNEVAPSEKSVHNRYALNFKIIDGEVNLPRGFINSQKLDLVISQLYSGALGVDDFDDLPRPFRCAAVDLETGSVEIFRRGNLGNAIRASMAIPSVFTPKEIDGRLYVDGGLIRNFPVDENRALGADIIIGVYVGGILEEREKLTSLVEILGQSAFMMGILDSEDQKSKVDILIEPDVKDYPSFGFSLTEKFIHEGYHAADAQSEKIEAIKERLKGYPKERKAKLRNPDAFKINQITFPVTPEPLDRLARFKFGTTRSRSYTIDEIEQSITNIFGTKYFDNISYNLEVDNKGDKNMAVIAPAKKGGQLYANLNYLPTTGTSLILHGEHRNLLGQPSVLMSSLRISEDFAARVRYNYRLGPQKDYVLLSEMIVQRYEQYSYEASTLREDYRAIDYSFSLGFASEPNNDFWMGTKFGLEANHLKPKGIESLGLSSYSRINTFAEVFAEYNTLNTPAFATKGMELSLNLGHHNDLSSSVESGVNIREFIPDDQAYWMGEFTALKIHSITNNLVIAPYIKGGWKSKPSFLDNYRIGGLEDRSTLSSMILGLNTDQFHLTQFVNLGGEIRVRVIGKFYASIKMDYINGELAFEQRSVDEIGEQISFLTYGLIGSLQTPLGPVRLGYGYNDLTNEWNTNLTVGYSFF